MLGPGVHQEVAEFQSLGAATEKALSGASVSQPPRVTETPKRSLLHTDKHNK